MQSVLLVLEATIGGTRRHLRDLALGLRRRGFKVDVVYSVERGGDFSADLRLFESAGIGLHEIKMRRRFSLFSDLLAVLRLRKILITLAPDIVHLHSSKAGFIGRLAVGGMSRRFLRVIYTPHCFAFCGDSLLRVLYKLAERLLMPRTDALIAVCQAEAHTAKTLGYAPGKIKVVHNGISANITDNASVVRDTKTVAFIGRFARQKGLDIFADACVSLKLCIPDIKIVVMSDVYGALRKKLLALGAEILPFSSTDEARCLLERVSVVAMPSRWEAFPYLLLEAFEHGAAVAAADVGGISECASDAVNALLVPPCDPTRLAAAIERLLLKPDFAAQLAKAARERVRDFTLKKMIDDTERVYSLMD